MQNELLQSQLLKTQKNNDSILSTKMISIETQNQKIIKDLKIKYENEYKNLIEFITTNLASLYGFDDIEFDQNEIINIFKQIKMDLNKLNEFQKNALNI